MNTSEDVTAFIKRHLPHLNLSGLPTPLPGGLMNHVWKVPCDPEPVILKHAPPYIATVPDIELNDSRIIFEAEALQAFSEEDALSSVPTPSTRPPKLLFRHDESHVIVTEDIGESIDLTVWLSHSQNKNGRFGSFLGQFIGALHNESFNAAAFAQRFNNHPIQQTRYTVQYESVGSLCSEAGIEDAEDLGLKARQLGTRLLQEGSCVIMGDLWPASIHITPNGLRIIDWEFVHYGNPAQDLAHLAAHLWMLQHRLPESKESVLSFWKQFIEAYELEISQIHDALWTPPIFEDASIHFGSEILVRTIGPFKQSYLYDDLTGDSPLLNEAITHATNCIRNSKSLSKLKSFIDSCPSP